MKENDIMVSVYCATYNHEKYIRNTLDGFVSQLTNFRFEVYVHDDASTDGTAKIIEEYSRKYPEIIIPIFQSENQYSKGIRIFETYAVPRMQGKYIAFCEGDDYWTDKYKLQMQVDFMEEHDEYSACVHNTVKLEMKTQKNNLMYDHERDEDICLEALVNPGEGAFHNSSVLCRSEFVHDQPKFVTGIKEVGDYPLAIYLVLVGKVYFINRPMSLYRHGVEGSWTVRVGFDRNKYCETLEQCSNVLQMADEFSEGKYTQIFQDAIVRTKYQIVMCKKEYGMLKKQPYKKCFEAEPFKIKVMVMADQHYQAIRKFLGKCINYKSKDE